MATRKEELVRQVRQRTYLGKDFDSLRSTILQYARRYYPDNIQDFSESSLGGLFLDMASYVGDTMSYYLDHQFNESFYDSAVESNNIQRHLELAGVPITGAAPSIVKITMLIEVPNKQIDGVDKPDPEYIPVIKAGTIGDADNGVQFNLVEDIDFNDKKSDDITYVADIKKGQVDSTGAATSWIMSREGTFVSGKIVTETFSISETFEPFKKITLSQPNVSQITNVTDDLGNVYYQVASLANDVVYKNVINTNYDDSDVKEVIKVVPAPYRYTAAVDLDSRQTTLTFGGGNSDSLEDDIIPDPSEFAIPFYYSTTFSRTSINPQKLIDTKTLGVMATNTSLNITYRYGGGLDHNAEPGTIQNVSSLLMLFENGPMIPAIASKVRASTSFYNYKKASGGDDAPDVEDLRSVIPLTKNSQERIVSKQDLLARIYTLPPNFGRVYRAAVKDNFINSLSSQLFVISKDENSKLTHCTDTLKENLVTYLDPYRLTNDAIDILDARIINFGLEFEVMVDTSLNKATVLQEILKNLIKFFDIKNSQIEQPIIISDVTSQIYNVAGVISVTQYKFNNLVGTIKNRVYSDQSHNIQLFTKKGIIIPPIGGIFEMKYTDFDIVGRAI